MTDSMEYPWSLVRSYHGVILHLIEQGKFVWGQPTRDLREQYLLTLALCQPMRPQPSEQYLDSSQHTVAHSNSEHVVKLGPNTAPLAA